MDSQADSTYSAEAIPGFQEPLRATLTRTITIAIVAGSALSLWRGGLAHWPAACLLMLWPSFGGHYVEIAYLRYVRPRLSAARSVQTLARVLVWFFGGIGLAGGLRYTANALGDLRFLHWPAWWAGGAALIGIELVAHLALQMRGLPSVYNNRGDYSSGL